MLFLATYADYFTRNYLEKRTGLQYNPRTFRSSFATILAQKGVDALHIMRLGRWETLATVDRYNRSRFQDSLRFYKPTV